MRVISSVVLHDSRNCRIEVARISMVDLADHSEIPEVRRQNLPERESGIDACRSPSGAAIRARHSVRASGTRPHWRDGQRLRPRPTPAPTPSHRHPGPTPSVRRATLTAHVPQPSSADVAVKHIRGPAGSFNGTSDALSRIITLPAHARGRSDPTPGSKAHQIHASRRTPAPMNESDRRR